MANTSREAMQRLAAKLREQEEKKTSSGGKKKSGDNASYPFWNMADGSKASIRFLPDADPNNEFFWAGREVIKLRFDGQEGGDYPTSDAVDVTVPCVDMFGDKCPIIAHTRPWWKQGPEMEKLARKYYKKKSYLFQGFVKASPFEEEELPENPIRRFVINPSIYKIIFNSMMNPEFEDMPVDYSGGREFTIRKTKQGEYANYATSGWSFSTRALNEEEMGAIDQYGLYNLSEFLGPRPDADGIAMIKQMFLDSVDGKPFDFAAYGHAYRAYSSRDRDEGDAISSVPAAAAAAAPVASRPAAAAVTARTAVTESTEPAEDAPAASAAPAAKPQAADILARIRSKVPGSGS